MVDPNNPFKNEWLAPELSTDTFEAIEGQLSRLATGPNALQLTDTTDPLLVVEDFGIKPDVPVVVGGILSLNPDTKQTERAITLIKYNAIGSGLITPHVLPSDDFRLVTGSMGWSIQDKARKNKEFYGNLYFYDDGNIAGTVGLVYRQSSYMVGPNITKFAADLGVTRLLTDTIPRLDDVHGAEQLPDGRIYRERSVVIDESGGQAMLEALQALEG